MAVSDLGKASFWRELLERAARQAAQTLPPIIGAIVSGGQAFNAEAVTIGLGVSIAVTVLKALSGVMATPAESWPWQLLDRTVPAMAGTVLGFVPIDAAGILAVDWTHVGVAALGAGLTAFVTFYAAPPTATHSTARHRAADS